MTKKQAIRLVENASGTMAIATVSRESGYVIVENYQTGDRLRLDKVQAHRLATCLAETAEEISDLSVLHQRMHQKLKGAGKESS